jgi:hypothetical protein
MADTSFTLPGGQKIPKKTLLIGGAVLVVVLVVLMRRGQSAEPGEEGQFGAQGDLGDGEGAGGFGGASDADLGSILAALSQMNQAPSQIYSPAPASTPTLSGGGAALGWSPEVSVVDKDLNAGFEDWMVPAEEYVSPYAGTEKKTALQTAAEFFGVGEPKPESVATARAALTDESLVSPAGPAFLDRHLTVGQTRVASFTRAGQATEQAARVFAKTVIKPATTRAQERAPAGQLQRWYTPQSAESRKTTTSRKSTPPPVRKTVTASTAIRRV